MSFTFKDEQFNTMDETEIVTDPVTGIYYVTWDKENGYVGKTVSMADLTSIKLVDVRCYSSIVTEESAFAFKDGALTWNGKLEKGPYYVELEIVYQGETMLGYGYLEVGYEIDLEIPLGYHLSRETDQYSSYEVLGSWITGGSRLDVTPDMTVDDAVKAQLEGPLEYNPNYLAEHGIYGYEFAGWSVFDSSTGKFTDLKGDEKIVDLLDDITISNSYDNNFSIYARYTKDGKEYQPVRVRGLDETVDPSENIPDTEEELEEAIADLPDEITTAEAREFDEAVEEILSGMNKVSADAQMKIAVSLGAKLKSALGLTLVVPEDGSIAADDSVFVAAGLTSSEDKGATVTLTLKNVATSSDAAKLGEFTVEMSVTDAEGTTTPVTKLEVPVKVTVTLPADLIASMANATKTYVVKIGEDEIKFDLDEKNNTITFMTSVLGHFVITEKTEPSKPDNNNQLYGGSSNTRSKAVDLNASGSWVQEADGRWWFKYTSGGYPAGKWELINNKWYYFNADGYMATGWQLIGNIWYHLDNVNGDMTTGWYQDTADGKWYYFSTSGAMLTGWQLIGGVYYYLSDTVAAPTYTYDATAEKWVYTVQGARPYGSMYAGETTPDGYTVDANGAWVQ